MNTNWSDLLIAAEQLAGFLIVMLALTVLWGLTALMGRLLALPVFGGATPVVATPAPTAAPAGAPAAGGPTDEEVVVIAAAVAAMIDGRHRVVSVRPVHSSWGQQGRREIHASHRIR